MSVSLHELRHLEERAGGTARRRVDATVRPVLRALLTGFTAAVILGALVGVLSARGAVRLYLVALVSAAGVVVVVQALAPFGRLERRPRRRRKPADPESPLPRVLEWTDRDLELAIGSIAHWEQLRRRLLTIAEQRLAGHGLRLQSGGARRVLGEQPWRLLERPLEGDKFAPGPQAEELDRLLEALERI